MAAKIVEEFRKTQQVGQSYRRLNGTVQNKFVYYTESCLYVVGLGDMENIKYHLINDQIPRYQDDIVGLTIGQFIVFQWNRIVIKSYIDIYNYTTLQICFNITLFLCMHVNIVSIYHLKLFTLFI